MKSSTIKKLHKMLLDGEISCVELTQKYIDEIKKNNDKLNAYVLTTEDEALKQAQKVDEKIKNEHSELAARAKALWDECIGGE